MRKGKANGITANFEVTRNWPLSYDDRIPILKLFELYYFNRICQEGKTTLFLFKFLFLKVFKIYYIGEKTEDHSAMKIVEKKIWTIDYLKDSEPLYHSWYVVTSSLVSLDRKYIYKCVNDVAGYHCKAWQCVMNNKGLQKPLIHKKNFNFNFWLNKNDLLGTFAYSVLSWFWINQDSKPVAYSLTETTYL